MAEFSWSGPPEGDVRGGAAADGPVGELGVVDLVGTAVRALGGELIRARLLEVEVVAAVLPRGLGLRLGPGDAHPHSLDAAAELVGDRALDRQQVLLDEVDHLGAARIDLYSR